MGAGWGGGHMETCDSEDGLAFHLRGKYHTPNYSHLTLQTVECRHEDRQLEYFEILPSSNQENFMPHSPNLITMIVYSTLH